MLPPIKYSSYCFLLDMVKVTIKIKKKYILTHVTVFNRIHTVLWKKMMLQFCHFEAYYATNILYDRIFNIFYHL